MLFSIIVPVYNTKPFLHRCLESLINQTYENLEIILVNDGSTDGSGDICNEYSSRDSRILVIHKENQGLSMARNSGIYAANGNLLIFVDSDDYIELNTCEIIRGKILKVQGSVDVVVMGMIKRYKNSSKIVSHTFISNNLVDGAKFLENELRAGSMHMASVLNVVNREFL